MPLRHDPTDDPGHRVVHLEGQDAVSLLLDLYLDGFKSGAASCAATFVAPGDDAACEEVGQAIAASLRADPLAMEVVRHAMTIRLTGGDTSGPAMPVDVANVAYRGPRD